MNPTTPTSTSPVLTFGDVTVTRAVESVGSLGMTPNQFLPGTAADAWEGQEHWLRPHFLESDADSTLDSTVRTAFQTWILRSGGKTVLIDAAIGDDKKRSDVPSWAHLTTGFIDRLAEAGVRPEDVDVVVNTHLHADHVGWNTRLDDGRWVPTFPNATYVINEKDLAFWDPKAANASKGPDARQVWVDSVQPLLDAGVVTTWSGVHRIDDAITVEEAPGHTPGSSVVRVKSGDAEALFVADSLHSPAQVADAHTSSCFDEDIVTANATRDRIFTEAAAHGTPLFPAHFGGHAGFTVIRNADGFVIAGWQPLDAI